ncbi:MAG TPA: aminoglycoside phosphotransferase family protein [Bacillales bacterium]|nr:aminoglycoside phosphotransferase family protein [Bacillales bacterium]
MSTKIFFGSHPLGKITDGPLQRMLDRFDLGELLSSEKTANGVLGQTMFVSSSTREYVLKGNPIFQGQFVEEKFFAENLRKRTKVPVPVPYMVDESDDIFGWPYALMPRLSGHHLTTGDIQAPDQIKMAELLAEALVELHKWKVDQYGEFNPETHTVRPFKGSYQSWLYNTIQYWLEDAKKYSEITSKDVGWAEEILDCSRETFEHLHSPAFVMGDFKPENILFQSGRKGWEVSGVFDFTNSYFGDPVADLPKMTAFYLDNGEEELARTFLSVYIRNAGINKDEFVKRFKVHMLHRRMLDWGCAKAIDQVTWDHDLSFSDWAERFTDSAANLLN